LKNYGVNLIRVLPAASRLPVTHSKQDEFVYVIEGEFVLVTDDNVPATGYALRKRGRGATAH
jgi:uncharacterized cupin superfamily protein